MTSLLNFYPEKDLFIFLVDGVKVEIVMPKKEKLGKLVVICEEALRKAGVL